MALYDLPPAQSPAPGAKPPRKQDEAVWRKIPQALTAKVLAARLELLYASLRLPAELHAQICLAVFPEAYAAGARSPSPLTSPPNSTRRLLDLHERAKSHQELFRDGDCDVPEDRAILVRPITQEHSSGTLAPKFRRKKGTEEKEMVEYEYAPMRGEGRANLPDCSDRCIREGDLRHEREAARAEARPGLEATVELLKEVFEQPKDVVQTFPARLRRARKKRGWGLKVLARKTGYTMAYLAMLERGKRRPSLEALEALATAYHASADEMVLTHWPDLGTPVGDPGDDD